MAEKEVLLSDIDDSLVLDLPKALKRMVISLDGRKVRKKSALGWCGMRVSQVD
jgi:hypothetical protein